ncbi:alpha-1,4-glucan:maltose-1-phosphate maltosyltransferase [Luteipulveratus halotolerans]|uniref:Alpha-1,4-glucan:maltose-1-phosphate maltosyltransferase n=1 Tax=Luteipulveratus halotolerans TaxID=1631356 RepID=A0A0L6CNI0_9MICO|nr:maltotransferase domain-containing protein [Luteipulveratus halotolerans]KNX39210.1 alpha-1,4-glucan:maltose-1-phosphate maltosyltransferase [Luteipulveratus halotolerans]
MPSRATHAPTPAARPHPVGRIPVLDVAPAVEAGALPARSVAYEDVPFSATVFREGHDAVNATLVVTDPDGHVEHVPMTCDNPGLDHWVAELSADRPGHWTYRVEGWSDPYGTWSHDAAVKVDAGVDVELMLEEGARLMDRAATELRLDAAARAVLADAATGLRDAARPVPERLAAGLSDDVRSLLRAVPLRDLVSPSPTYDWLVERERALTGAWYEIFPRSEGAHRDPTTGVWTSGTFRTAMRRLPAIAHMGFDVVYLTPIHPIGEVNRKGPNNTLDAGPLDPGSPYAIGSKDGGHDAIHPDLGTFEDFDAFVAEAQRLGLEVALDLALQCAPDHPWVTEHPEWFTTRADGTIAYAENPPKKYQDIYPVNFDNDPDGIYAEVRRVVQVWIDHGVKIFRVDNPHTKPVEFWQWLISDVASSHPDVIWLAEAFTKPAMMHTLAKVGFQQSYTYYAWRNEAAELREYCEELAGEAAAYMRPSFWPTTHDILTPYMQYGGPTAWRLRAALAATLVPTYGIYTGYELMENVARPGAEEQIDNEKYEYKDRHWPDFEPGGPRYDESLAPYLTRLNEIRRAHPALHWLRNLHFHQVDDDTVLAFSKRRVLRDGTEDVIIVVAATDPHSTREAWVHLDLDALGLQDDEWFTAHDLITDSTWRWGEHVWVRLGRDTEPVHIVHVRRS